MIYLQQDMLISTGTVRACYHHPKRPDLLIKVPLRTTREKVPANVRELKGYQTLMLKYADLFCITHCFGFVSTNLGKGLVCECIRDDSGDVSKTIRELILADQTIDISHLLAVAGEFCNYLQENDIWVFDLNMKNIVFRQNHDKSYTPYLIDLKGHFENKEFIPLSRYLPFFARKKLDRRCKQLLERIRDFREHRKELRETMPRYPDSF